jgi:hypothetical protein
MRHPVFLLLLALAVPGAAVADGRVRGLDVHLDGRRVLVDFRLEDGFDHDLVERVRSGLPTSFTYELELLRDRKRWFDRPLDTGEIQVVATFDAVAQEYLVNYKLNGKLIESRMVRSLEELRRAMTRFEGLPAFTLEPLPRRWRLLVKVRALLGTRTAFSLVPVRDTTDWKESDKFWAPTDLMPGQ